MSWANLILLDCGVKMKKHMLLTRPSLMSLRMFCLELALAISLISLGSNQTLFLPHFITEEASLF